MCSAMHSNPSGDGGDDEEISPAFFVVPKPGAVTPEIEQARLTVLKKWVWERYVAGNLDFYPPKGMLTGRGAPPPFPECAFEHPLLVTRLELLKLRADQLEDGTVRGYTPEDWHRYNEHYVVALAWKISGRCQNRHIELSAPRTARPVVMSRPPLPGEVRLRPEAGPPIPKSWRDELPPPDPPGIEP